MQLQAHQTKHSTVSNWFFLLDLLWQRLRVISMQSVLVRLCPRRYCSSKIVRVHGIYQYWWTKAASAKWWQKSRAPTWAALPKISFLLKILSHSNAKLKSNHNKQNNIKSDNVYLRPKSLLDLHEQKGMSTINSFNNRQSDRKCKYKHLGISFLRDQQCTAGCIVASYFFISQQLHQQLQQHQESSIQSSFQSL